MTRHYPVSLLLLILAGCAHSSAIPPKPGGTPDRWEATMPVATGEMPGAWWSSFDDPVLDAMIDGGMKHNVDLRIAAERVLGSQALRRAATAGLFPDIRAEASANEARGATGLGDAASAGIGAGWEPDISGRLSAAVRAARADIAASAADAEAVRLLLVEEIARAYIDYRLQRRLIALNRSTVDAQEETLRITRDRFEFGMANRLDVERAAALVSQTRSEHAVAAQAAAAARFRLSYLLSETPEAIAARLAGGDVIPVADPLTILRSPADVLGARPDIRLAEARYAASAARRDGAAALRLPSLSLSGLIGLDGNGVGALIFAKPKSMPPIRGFAKPASNMSAPSAARSRKPRPRSSPISRARFANANSAGRPGRPVRRPSCRSSSSAKEPSRSWRFSTRPERSIRRNGITPVRLRTCRRGWSRSIGKWASHPARQ